MNRRQFILLAQAVGLSAYFGEIAFTQSGTVRIRKSAISDAAATDIATLRQGIALLKTNPQAMEYASWMYWANSHGTDAVIPPEMATVWGQCKHKTTHFLTWHRAFLFFFEALIRELTQVDDFALPYWDWYTSKQIPPAYAAATLDNGEVNPLYHSLRAFMERTLLMDAFTKSSFATFQTSLENNPHGSVHVMTGGEMGVVIKAARDPVFFAHHANVDRLWNVWLAMDPLHRNNTTTSFVNQSFTFDLAGQKTLQVRNMLNTENLGYQYDSLTPLGPSPLRMAATLQVDATPARPLKTLALHAMPPSQQHAHHEAMQGQRGIQISGEPVTLLITTPPMHSLIARSAPEGNAITLMLNGVKATALGLKQGFDYRVYLNLPREPGIRDKHGDYYLGVINSFQLGHHGMHGDGLSFDLAPLMSRLQRRGLWKDNLLKVSLISDDVDEHRPLIEIGGASVQSGQ